MKSISSSTSSAAGSKKASATGIISCCAYTSSDPEVDGKSEEDSRISCTSDDSCAINELLEGRMDLRVTLPDKQVVVVNVERRTPMMDLLVSVSTKYRLNAANYKLVTAGGHHYKANTPVGSLDVNQIAVEAKQLRTNTLKPAAQAPVQNTFRLQVNLPRNQLMVLRATPNASVASIKQLICSEKCLDPDKYQLVRLVGDAPQVLDPRVCLASYSLTEVTLLANKTLMQLQLQLAAPNTSSQLDLATGHRLPNDRSAASLPASFLQKKASFCQSTPNISNTVVEEKAKSVKKRPAPPPPKDRNLPVKSEPASEALEEKSQTKAAEPRVISNGWTETTKVGSTLSEQAARLRNGNGNHVRQNSGSDSSGYHESVLSCDSPESSSAAVAGTAASSLTTETGSAGNSRASSSRTCQSSSNKTPTGQSKKRRAPPPPGGRRPLLVDSQSVSVIDSRQRDRNKDMDGDDDKSFVHASVDCLSDVSLPVSTSSTSSGAISASSTNNPSLSPTIVIAENRLSTGQTGSSPASGSPVPGAMTSMSASATPPSVRTEAEATVEEAGTDGETVESSGEQTKSTHDQTGYQSQEEQVSRQEGDVLGCYSKELGNKNCKGIALERVAEKKTSGATEEHGGSRLDGDISVMIGDEDNGNTVSSCQNAASRPEQIEGGERSCCDGVQGQPIKWSCWAPEAASQTNVPCGVVADASSCQQSAHPKATADQPDAALDLATTEPESGTRLALEAPAATTIGLIAPVDVTAPGCGSHDLADHNEQDNGKNLKEQPTKRGLNTVMATDLLIEPPPNFGDRTDRNDGLTDDYGLTDGYGLTSGYKPEISHDNGDGTNHNDLANHRNAGTCINSAFLGGGSHVNTNIQRNLHVECRSKWLTSTITEGASDLELVDMSLPLPPPSPFRNSDCEEDAGQDTAAGGAEDGQVLQQSVKAGSLGQQGNQRTGSGESDKELESLARPAKESRSGLGVCSQQTIEAVSRSGESDTQTTPAIVSLQEDNFNEQVELTLKSLDDELDSIANKSGSATDSRLDNDVDSDNGSEWKQQMNDQNTVAEIADAPRAGRISVQVKQITTEQIDNRTDESSHQPTQALLTSSTASSGKSTVTLNNSNESRASGKSQTPTSYGRTKVMVNKWWWPTAPEAASPQQSDQQQPTSCSPEPSLTSMDDRDGLSSEQVRRLCRPRVKLVNFSIGTYKKDVDIFAEPGVREPVTAPVDINKQLPGVKPVVVTASLKQQLETREKPQQKSMVSITSSKPFASESKPTLEKSTFPVIQTLNTSAPKISRIQSWSGARSQTIDRMDVDRRTNDSQAMAKEKCFSQIAFQNDLIKVSIRNSPSQKTLRSDDEPNQQRAQTVTSSRESQTLEVKNGSTHRGNSDVREARQFEAGKKEKQHTTILIRQSDVAADDNYSNNNNNNLQNKNQLKSDWKTGKILFEEKSAGKLNRISHQEQAKKENAVSNNNNNNNNDGNHFQSVTDKTASRVELTLNAFQVNQTANHNNANTATNIPTPPQLPNFGKTNNVKSNTLGGKTVWTGPVGWSDKRSATLRSANASANVPKVTKRIESSPSGIDTRDALLNEIRSFGGRDSLKKVAKNSSWQLQVHGFSVK